MKKISTFLPLVAVVAAAALPSAASAAPALNGEFAAGGKPGQIAQGPDGNMWAVLSSTHDLARIAPDGTVTNFDATDILGPVGITAGPDGNMWVTQTGGVAKFSPADPTSATKTPVAAITDARRIVSGPGGKLYTASADKVVVIDPANPAGATNFTVPGMGARGITAGSDGTLWVADFGGQRIVNVKTDGTGQTFYATPGGPQEVGAGADAQVAFGNPGGIPQTIGRISPGGAPQTADVPGTDPFGIAFGTDGAYWFANFANQTVTRMAADGQTSSLPMPAASGPRWIAAGPGNTLWVSLETSEKVARITGVEKPAETPTTTPTTPTTTPTTTGKDTTAPVVSGVTLTRKTLRLKLSESAGVQVRIERAAKGKKRGAKCVKATRANRKAKGCTRWIPAGTLKVLAGAGQASLKLAKPLALGKYRVIVAVKDGAGNSAAAKTVTSSITR
jgi:streptogramin lyase